MNAWIQFYSSVSNESYRESDIVGWVDQIARVCHCIQKTGGALCWRSTLLCSLNCLCWSTTTTTCSWYRNILFLIIRCCDILNNTLKYTKKVELMTEWQYQRWLEKENHVQYNNRLACWISTCARYVWMDVLYYYSTAAKSFWIKKEFRNYFYANCSGYVGV